MCRSFCAFVMSGRPIDITDKGFTAMIANTTQYYLPILIII